MYKKVYYNYVSYHVITLDNPWDYVIRPIRTMVFQQVEDILLTFWGHMSPCSSLPVLISTMSL